MGHRARATTYPVLFSRSSAHSYPAYTVSLPNDRYSSLDGAELPVIGKLDTVQTSSLTHLQPTTPSASISYSAPIKDLL